MGFSLSLFLPLPPGSRILRYRTIIHGQRLRCPWPFECFFFFWYEVMLAHHTLPAYAHLAFCARQGPGVLARPWCFGGPSCCRPFPDAVSLHRRCCVARPGPAASARFPATLATHRHGGGPGRGGHTSHGHEGRVHGRPGQRGLYSGSRGSGGESPVACAEPCFELCVCAGRHRTKERWSADLLWCI